MFETSTVSAHAFAARRRYTLLSVSLVAHTAAIIGAVAASVATVKFPAVAPDQFAMLRPVAAVTIPPPLGCPTCGQQQRQQVEPPRPAPVQPPQNTAPSIVPESTTPVQATSTSGDGTADPAATEAGPRGVPWGDPNSVATDLDLPPAQPATPVTEDKVYRVGGEVKAPRVISRVLPRYPQAMIHIAKSATVTARCIIDRNGNLRDIQILRSTFPAFDPAVREAMSQWRFAPGSLNGQAVDTEFELTVNFSVQR